MQLLVWSQNDNDRKNIETKSLSTNDASTSSNQLRKITTTEIVDHSLPKETFDEAFCNLDLSLKL